MGLDCSAGNFGTPSLRGVQAVIEDESLRMCEAGKAAGILMADETKARRYIELGALYVAVGSDVAGFFQWGKKISGQKFRGGRGGGTP